MRRDHLWYVLLAGVLAACFSLSTPAHAIKRCEVLKRAQAWVDDPNAWYSWDPTYTDPTTKVCCYRPDCSGMVSASWGLPPPGRTTYHFAGGVWDDKISYLIAPSELKPGDALNFPGDPNAGTGHVMLYVSGDFNSGYVEVMEEYNYGHTAERRWRNFDTDAFLPIRYKHIEDDGPEICNGIDDDCDGQVDEDNVCQLEQVLWGAAMYAPARTTDVNGDGKADVCGRGSAGLWCYLSNGDSWGAGTKVLAISDEQGWGNEKYYTTIRFGDINGDGKSDVCGRGHAGVSCWLSTGDGFANELPPIAWSDEGGWVYPKYYSTIRLLDMDGDGKDDVCARAARGMTCHKSNGNSFGEAIDGPSWSDAVGFGEPWYYTTIRVADINGDRKDDLCIRTAGGIECFLSDGAGFPTVVAGPELKDANGWAAPQYYTTIRFADVNGDGKDDLCARGAAGLACYFSNGDSFGPSVMVAELSDAVGWADEDNYTTLRTGDIDGDGAQDLCIRANKGMLCYRWTGGAFESVEGPAWGSSAGWNERNVFYSVQLADINGDAKADLCARASSGWECQLSQGNSFGPRVAVEDFTDSSGWGERRFASTVRAGGPLCRFRPELCNGRDDNCNGEVDEGCLVPGPDGGLVPGPDGGAVPGPDSGGDGGKPNPGNRDASAHDNGGDDSNNTETASCSCTAVGGTGRGIGGWWLFAALGLAGWCGRRRGRLGRR